MKLEIELVPTTSWFSNVRSNVSKEEWDVLRKECYKKANYKCEICGGKGKKWPVEAHEIWEYNDDKKIQKLVRLIALCPACHEVKHIGFAKVKGREKEATEYLMKINNISENEADEYLKNVWEKWRDRNNYEWKLDTTILKRQP